MLHELLQTYLLLDGHETQRTHVRETRSRRWTARRRRLLGILRTPATRIPTGVHYA